MVRSDGSGVVTADSVDKVEFLRSSAVEGNHTSSAKPKRATRGSSALPSLPAGAARVVIVGEVHVCRASEQM